MTQPIGQPPPRNMPVLDGSVFTLYWSGWFGRLWNLFQSGYSGTVVLTKLTGGGANGSMTLVNGVVTTYVAPT